ncbi:transglycosylase domain-containing protein [Kutzneria sp. CA-103260]|uniref:transglycosylase domain-containing protein n=1 Tax=Kutzneria sp. CA-103260 TaxID=2802641 RepID=UPI001BACAD3D|nr:transglycosylase domain-containing protein [Kutzneria sp. CA-103260]
MSDERGDEAQWPSFDESEQAGRRGGGQPAWPGEQPTTRGPGGRPPVPPSQQPTMRGPNTPPRGYPPQPPRRPMGPGGPPPGGRGGPPGPNGMGGRPPGPGQRGGPNQPTQRSPFNQPTDMLPPVHEEYQREPELMTHREHDLPPGARDYLEPDEYLENEADEATLRKKRIWRRVRRSAYVLCAVGFVGPIVAFIITYFMVTPPDPLTVLHQQQTMTIFYADGSVMATLGPSGGGDKTILTIDKIPKVVQHAVEAAEDETFETNSGFDIKGIGRAVLSQLRGNGGGGSGITQQYVKKATGNEDHTLTRKWTELVQAIKMSQVQSKDQILDAYLNTVYFGRGAYGIQAASQAYFGKNIDQLNPSEAAFLAGCINVPAYNEDPTWTNGRWTYTMGRMVANGWLSQTDRDQYKEQPKPVANSSDGGGALDGKTTFAVRQILAEAGDPNFGIGKGRDDLQQLGAQIHTTIDKKAMQQAEDAANAVMSKDTPHNPNIASSLVSIDPKTGGIVAWYGGSDTKAWSLDMADTAQQPGSSFKPLVFLAGMRANSQIGLQSLYNGTSGQTIGGRKVNNADEESCGQQCTVWNAMTQSVNTVFYKMTDDIGPSAVRKAAFDAGIATTQVLVGQRQPALQNADGTTADGIGIGQYEVRPRDMAQAYATLANNGVYIPSHFITSIKDSSGGNVYDASANGKLVPTQAFDKTDSLKNAQLARNVTESMTKVAASSCADRAKTICANLQGNRPVAAKTGTAQYEDTGHNSNAWMVGYTPQVVTAVWTGTRNGLAPIYGYYQNHIGPSQDYDIYGREEPSYIWQKFMNTYLQGKPVENFTPFKDLGGKGNFSGFTTTTTPTDTTTTGSSTTTDTTTPSDDPTSTNKHHPPTSSTCAPFIGCQPTDTSTTTKTNGNSGGPPGGFGGNG